jgi:hypothetical protein
MEGGLKIMAARHGSRTLYGRGCRCQRCADANREYQHEYKRRKAARVTPTADDTVRELRIPPLPGEQPAGVGRVEAAVFQEISGLSSRAVRPGLTQLALSLARTVDDECAVAQRAANGRMLFEVLERLRKTSAATEGRLASVRHLANRQA